MQNILKLQQKIVPELIELLQKRYDILRIIYYNGPIGRRILANDMCISERIVRNEINFLKSQNLIEVNASGMFITNDGEEIVNRLKEYIHEIKGLSKIEKSIEKHLKLQQVIVVPGDVDIDKSVLKELGKIAASYAMDIIKDNSIIALTGGSTVKEVVEGFPRSKKYNNILILPARGGMARNVDIQANTLVSRLAEKIGGDYELLHAPDNLSDVALETILNEKEIKNIIDKIRRAEVLIYGIGIASDMAKKRGLTDDEIKNLQSLGAVGETFGHYYNESGKIVHSTPTIGVKNEDVINIKTLIAVAAGKNKARAIIATEINRSSTVLIIDEAAAKEIVNIIEKKE
ncbi:sugar-binding transcriptional regulator [Clostridium bowmanii]|uniref:sugar-binding transcriptional regulator n=1 Tax=Clostridium bowmanii TaxID=132925 RepID=UPI001C0D3463|nr:sugar-binding domain-containing protein [Clostridium bowmanii]MBU3191073.1 sugar-binding transcriptional regulator [Clostridium bowmanii]MCA1075493.1 sugar-binding transcriptional regulator [Clostridium bowmanii]